ncbi:MAG: metal-dependent transcriptional regulator [Bacilli bacterium]|nr:metal-dependent transcriptional regulator [Bacilli bacterium]
MKLSKSIEDYLETILLIEKETAKTVKSVDIASSLNVSKPAVTKAMNELKELGFIHKDLYGEISLTDEGRSIAEKIYDKHKTINTFLQRLGVSKETAEVDCCNLEHAISDETLQKLKEFLEK